jgi:hypothetical protein
MTLIVLTTIGFLACAFYVYVLVHWMRDTNRKRPTYSAAEDQVDEKCDPKRPHIVDFRRAAGSDGRFVARSLRPASMAERSHDAGLAMSANGMRARRSRDH